MRRPPTFALSDVAVWRWDATARLRRPILGDVDWRAEAGETWALLGPNGAGKTTLLNVLGAVEFPSSGSVELLGERLGATDVFALRERIGFVDPRLGRRFQPELTVEQVVHTGATGTIGLFDERVLPEQRERAGRLLQTMGVDHLASRRFGLCSHGERTRTLVARALVARPELLLLDEPGSGLDFGGRETLLAAVSRLAVDQPDLTVVLTTHHLEELPPSTTHALLLAGGRIVAAGAAETTVTDTTLSACFGLDVRVTRTNGRWQATAAPTGLR